MSETNGNGLPLRAALKAVRHRRRLAVRAALARIAATDFEGAMAVEEQDDDNEQEEEEDGSTEHSRDVAGA
jgi:hypothetical protein